MKYYLLTGWDYKGLLIKKEPETLNEWYYDKSLNSWERIAVMIDYRWYEHPAFGLFKELTEEEAFKYIEQANQ